jgi:hypothetical protein
LPVSLVAAAASPGGFPRAGAGADFRRVQPEEPPE